MDGKIDDISQDDENTPSIHLVLPKKTFLLGRNQRIRISKIMSKYHTEQVLCCRKT